MRTDSGRWAFVTCWIFHLVGTEAATPIITKTVHSTCSRSTRGLPLPYEGWIVTNGTTLPYTFGSSTTSLAANDITLATSGSSTSTITAVSISIRRTDSSIYLDLLDSGTATATPDEPSQTISSLALGTDSRSTISATSSPLFVATTTGSPIAASSSATGVQSISISITSSQLLVASATGSLTAAPLSTASFAAITRIGGGTVTSTVFGGTTLTQTASGITRTTIRGGFTTTFTTGGTTQTIFGLSEPTSTSSSIQDAVIGRCPAYDGRVFQDEDGVAFLVACGSTYDGNVISLPGRRSLQKRATPDDCISQCRALGTCVASSYSNSTCTFFGLILGVIPYTIPVFSAARIVLDTLGSSNTTGPSDSALVPDPIPSDVQFTSSSPPSSGQGIGMMTTTQLVFSISTATLTLSPSTIVSTLPASTFTVTTVAPGQTTTAFLLSTLPASTTLIVLPGSISTRLVTFTETSLMISTLVSRPPPETETTVKPAETIVSTLVSFLPASSFTTTIERTLPASTIVVTTSLPGQTATTVYTTALQASTTTLTTVSIREASSVTYYVTSTLPEQTATPQPSTLTETVLLSTTILLPAPTQTVFLPTTLISISQPPAGTVISTEIRTLVSSYWQTVTATTTLPMATETLNMVSTFLTSFPVTTTAISTHLVTLTSLQNLTEVLTLPPSTEISMQEVTVLSTYTTTEISSYPVTTTEISTQLVTLTSIQNVTQDVTLPPSTQTSTEMITVVYTYLTTETTSYPVTTTAITTQLVTLTNVQNVTQDFTLPASTRIETELVPLTVTSTQEITVISTELASTRVQTELVPTIIISTQQTIVISTQLASTRIQTELVPTTIVSTQQNTVVSTQLASTRIETQLVPTTVISTQLASTRIETETLLIPTTVITTRQTTIVSTQLALTRTDTLLISTTVVSTQLSLRTETVTASTTIYYTPPTVTVSVYDPVPSCLSGNDGQTFTTSDGSQYVMLCGRDNSASNVFGVASAPAGSFSACLNRCSAQGTVCTGITWQASNQQCVLKKEMTLTGSGGTISSGMDSAIRLTGPGGVNGRTQRLTNGGFDSGALSPWFIEQQNACFYCQFGAFSVAISNNAALLTAGQWSYYQMAMLQDMQANAGDLFYVTYSYSVSSFSGASVQLLLTTDGNSFGYIDITANSPKTTLHASGTIDSTYPPGRLQLYVSGSNMNNLAVTLDDFSLYTYPASAGADPVKSVTSTLFGPTNLTYDNAVGTSYAMSRISSQQPFQLTVVLTVTVSAGDECGLYLYFQDQRYRFPQDLVQLYFTASQVQILRVEDSYYYFYTENLRVQWYCNSGNYSPGNQLKMENLTIVVPS